MSTKPQFHITYTIDHSNVVCFCVSLQTLALYALSTNITYYVNLVSSGQDPNNSLNVKDYKLIASILAKNPNIKLKSQVLYFGEKGNVIDKYENTLLNTLANHPNHSFEEVNSAVLSSLSQPEQQLLVNVLTTEHLQEINQQFPTIDLSIQLTTYRNISPEQLKFAQGQTISNKSLELSYLKVFIPLVLDYVNESPDTTLYCDLDTIFTEDPYRLYQPIDRIFAHKNYYVAACKKVPFICYINPIRFQLKQYIALLDYLNRNSIAKNYVHSILGGKTGYELYDTGVMYLNLKQIKQDQLQKHFLLAATNFMELPQELYSENIFREEDYFMYIFNHYKNNTILNISNKFNLSISNKEWLLYHNHKTNVLDKYTLINDSVFKQIEGLVPTLGIEPKEYVQALPEFKAVIHTHNDLFPWLNCGQFYQDVMWWAAAYSTPFFQSILSVFGENNINQTDLEVLNLLNQYYFQSSNIKYITFN